MPYLSLYRKYRPQTFDEILGQEHVSATLAGAITEDRVAHAYLFTGPRGTGKTSMARILAKALNCEKGPTPTPCGVCASCVAITDGSSLDVIEMDAASHSKVDETREILSGVPLATAGGRRKVYVIDEVHMLSTPSFNALLKTLEEPPPHVVFILATTEAHKVLPTIVSRTQRFDFRRATVDVLQPYLEKIAKLEGMDVEPAALGVLARHAEGSFRDALSALDQLSSFGDSVTAEDVERLLGERNEDAFTDIFDAIADGDVGRVFSSLHSLVAQGGDPRQLALGTLEHARALLLLRTAPESEDLLDVADEDRPVLLAQSERFSAGALVRTIDLLAKSLIEMRNAPNHRLLLEIALVRAAAPETDPSGTGLQGRIERLERRIGIDASTEPAPAHVATSAPAPAPRPTQPRPKPAPRRAEPAAQVAAPAPVEAEPPAQEPPAQEPPAQEPPARPVAPAGVPAEVGLSAIKDSWPATLGEVKRRSIRVWGLLDRSRPVRFEDERLVVEVQSDFHAGEMTSAANRDVLAQALHAALGVGPALSFVQQDAGARTAPSPKVEDVPEYSASAADETVAHDPVELVKRGLGAEVVEEKPTTR